jgi:hypothetical protein
MIFLNTYSASRISKKISNFVNWNYYTLFAMNGQSLSPLTEKLNLLEQIFREVFARDKIDWEKLKINLGKQFQKGIVLNRILCIYNQIKNQHRPTKMKVVGVEVK